MPRAGAARQPERPLLRFAAFFAIGVYGGAFQPGVGVLLLNALSRAGVDLIRSTQIKTALHTCATLLALPVFFWAGGRSHGRRP